MNLQNTPTRFLFLLLSLAVYTSPLSANSQDIFSNVQKEDVKLSHPLIISFNDIRIYRRCDRCAPAMGSGNEDYIVKIECISANECRSKIPEISKVLSEASETQNECLKASYVRINFDDGDIYDVDSTGLCMSHGKTFYRLRKSIFDTLLKKSPTDW